MKKILLICPSSIPSFCGIAKFTNKLILILQEAGHSCKLVTNRHQKQRSGVEKEFNYPVAKIDVTWSNLNPLLKQVVDFKADIIHIEYNSTEFGRRLFPSLLPFFLKLLFPKKELQVMIHEFSNYTILGKIRHTLPVILADKVFCSDNNELTSLNKFTKGIFNRKLEVLTLGILSNSSSGQAPKKDFKPITNEREINILFHGHIQPSNGLDYLIQAMQILNKSKTKYKFKLNIFGDIKQLINYGNRTEEITKYQESIKEQLKDLENYKIFGDIDPESDQFKGNLEKMDLFVFPDTFGINIRRSSFWFITMQTFMPIFSTYVEGKSDEILANVIVIQPKSGKSIANEILKFVSLEPSNQIAAVEKVKIMQDYMSPEKITKRVLNRLV